MRIANRFAIILMASLSVTLLAQKVKPDQPQHQQAEHNDAESDRSWTKALENRAKRGTLHDQLQYVRGDSGKWSEMSRLQHVPPIQKKPAKMALDDWTDELLEKKFQLTNNDDNWLLFRTRQLDDNDRVWVERIERRANQFTVIAHEAVWQGRYQKNFTCYQVFGVNLGKLDPGTYEAKWIVMPLVFNKFEEPGSPRDNWPKDERPADKKPTEFRLALTIVAEVP